MKASFKIQSKNARSLNNKGFTMLEMLFAFTIFLVIISFIPLFLRMIIQDESINARLNKMEWEVFASQVKKEIRMSDRLQISGSRLLIERDGQLILYEKYGEVLRRRVDFQGHEVLLQRVESVQFEKLQNGVQITIADKAGAINAVNVRSYIDLEVVE